MRYYIVSPNLAIVETPSGRTVRLTHDEGAVESLVIAVMDLTAYQAGVRSLQEYLVYQRLLEATTGRISA